MTSRCAIPTYSSHPSLLLANQPSNLTTKPSNLSSHPSNLASIIIYVILQRRWFSEKSFYNQQYRTRKNIGPASFTIRGCDLADGFERLTVNSEVATVLGSSQASSDRVESQGRQIKQYIKKFPKNPTVPYPHAAVAPLVNLFIFILMVNSIYSDGSIFVTKIYSFLLRR